MFKVNSKNTRMKSLAPLFHTFSVSTVDIEQVNEYWVRKQTWQNTTFYYNRLTRVKFTFGKCAGLQPATCQ